MRTARRSSLEGALIGKVLTVVRGERSITIPARELPELVELLQELAPALADIVDETPTAFEVVTSTSQEPAATARPAPAAPPAAAAAPRSTRRPTRARRGRVWEGIKRVLASRNNQPVGFDTLLDMVRTEGLTERNPEHALKIALGKKVRTGELVEVSKGLYRMADSAAAQAPGAGAAKPRRRKKRKHRPGELWKNMREHLSEHPEGLTRDELVEAAREGRWTSAQDPLHAVKICLTRVGDQIVQRDGRYLLAEHAERPTPPPTPTVKRRKKTEAKAAEDAPANTDAEAAGEEPARSEDDPHFEASRFYPTPRSRMPR